MGIAYRSKKEVIYERLKDDILQGNIEPGSRLVIDDLASKLNVSQIPIREAIRQLEADGFVTTEPYVGATVTEIDATFIFEVFALLESMEVICGRAACETMTHDDWATLSQMIDAMAATMTNPAEWSQQNKALHLFICQCAHTELVLKMLTKVLDHWDRLRLQFLRDVSSHRIEAAQAEHQTLLAALKQRDADAVEHLIREHNQRALASYIEHLQTQGHLV
ncbi:GntR family transcriptional regulator [Phototrophicus methaneseepsis]|uniref:GntR family transcriptional regulator n=1 Tax=Phototrophicus methaneseepsis TaxID=2710758 RepID=A0A7S8EBY7_9CHLR|nr:GntR family transcriptional regulator [Phototrophicus methaneseepsis]QPC84114.1 GntR family transcriptional regulator [Phototrophicus methaneseepsis]